MLKLMYITNDPQIALAAEAAGVDRIFIDMEYIGKADRQGGMDTVQSDHTIEDIRNIRRVLTTSELLVRCNPVHDATEEYCSTEEEIEGIIKAGADIIMLPYFQNAQQVERFLKAVDGRVKTILLVETPEAVDNLDDILSCKGIDECHIGINDLHLGYHRKFMFELLADGTVERICNQIKSYDIPYGFGGIARPGTEILRAEKIIGEHVRLGSSTVILSRSFYDQRQQLPLDEVKVLFKDAVNDVRKWENRFSLANHVELEANRQEVIASVNSIVERMQ